MTPARSKRPDHRSGSARPVLGNPASDRVKMIRALAGRFGRFGGDARVVAEGPQAVREAVATGRVVDLYLSEAAAANWPDWAGSVRAGGGYVHLATEAVLTAISPASQGVVGVIDWPVQDLAGFLGEADAAGVESPTPDLEFEATERPPAAGLDNPAADRKSVTVSRPPALVALFEEISDPGNAGTAIRAADAAGADAVVFSFGSVDPRSAKVIRASAGSAFHLAVMAGESLENVIGRLRSAGCQVLAADGAGQWDIDVLSQVVTARAAADATAHNKVRRGAAVRREATSGVKLSRPDWVSTPDLRAPTVWLFGNEARGLSDAARAAADATVRLPIYGQAESLNLAMAATLCLYASARAHATAKRG